MRSFCLKKRMTCLIERNRSAVVLQCIWRRHFAHRRYSTLLLRHQASITIQYFWRLAQLRDSKTNAAAMQIQKLFRGYWSRFQFVIYVLDIIAVQSCSRRWLAKRYCEKLYGSTITLQRAIRCFFARRSLVQKRLSAFRSTSAIRVQTIVRQCLAKNVLVFTRRYAAATILMQSLWRKRQAQLLLTEMNIFKEERNSSVLIQSRWRCWKAKLFLDTLKVTKNERLASTMIQSQWRKVHAQHLLDCVKKDLICRVAAVFIQGAFRRQQARLCLAKLKLHAVRVNASVVVQSFWRGFYARLLSKSMHFAATHIQATARCLVQTRHFTALRKNAVLIQARWKTTIVVREFQACVDGIRLIQSIVRRYLANKRCCRRQDALLRLQCSGRNFLARSQYWELMRTKAFRDNASITLQRYWRGYCAFVKFHLVTQDILLIQSAYRRFLAVKISETRRWAVECLQQAVRRALACNCLRILQAQKKSEDLAEFDAANRIQAVFRGWLVRNVCAHLSHCALKVQRVFRGHVARIDCFLETLDIILVQSTVRRWLSRRSACRRCAAVLRLQYATRCFLARSELGLLIAAHQRANLEWYSAAIVQCACRKLSARRLALKESSALTIQKLWRCYTVHINYMLSILAAIEIQKAIRRYIAVSTYEFQFFAITSIQSFARLALYKIRAECEESSAVRMQSAVRMHSSRTAFLLRITEHRSVIRLQSITRKLTARSRFLLKKIAATVIQRFIRGFVARLQLETECFAASEIQRTWRGFLASEYLAWNILAAIKTQSFFRMLLAQRRADHYMLERLVTQRLRSRSVIKIQRAYLGYVYQTMIFTSACILQKAARHFLSRIAFGKVRLGVVRAQSLARGRTVRHKLSPEILARAICIERVNANARAAPRLKLSNRTTAALDTLLKSENLSELMDAVCILEVATRLSEVCCILFVKASAPSVLFSLIRTCNRSLPHVKLLHGVLLTMSNVAEYDHLLQSIATHEGAEVLLDLVQMFRDKNFVFFLVVSLLERVVRSKNDEVLVRCQFI